MNSFLFKTKKSWICIVFLTGKHTSLSLFQLNAAKAADKRFKSTLKNAGIDENFVHTHSSTAPSARSDEYDEDDDNATFTKSRYHDEEEALSWRLGIFFSDPPLHISGHAMTQSLPYVGTII